MKSKQRGVIEGFIIVAVLAQLGLAGTALIGSAGSDKHAAVKTQAGPVVAASGQAVSTQ